ncbi:MAG: D-Ala-D-Ala carboxypeptidase family metallohydrolase [Gemmatimonadota bacterium]
MKARLTLGLTAAATFLLPARPAAEMPPVVVAAEPVGAPAAPLRWTPTSAGRPARATFALEVAGTHVPLRVMALAVQPGEEVTVAGPGVDGTLSASDAGGRLRSMGRNRWTWTAPEEPGFHAVRVVSSEPADTIDHTLMVAHPAEHVREGSLHGYAIGSYRARPASMSAVYEPPPGFIEVRPEDHDILVSPNFRLGQFLCKQPGDPRFAVVSPALLLQLEALLVAVNEAGYATSELSVMSGFRTPAYNRAIGNTTDFSRHLWGDAADVYVDNDRNGEMDDVNRDGRVDLADGRWLADVAERMMREGRGGVPAGGLSIYPPNSVHGPFVHVDARGHFARW